MIVDEGDILLVSVKNGLGRRYGYEQIPSDSLFLNKQGNADLPNSLYLDRVGTAKANHYPIRISCALANSLTGIINRRNPARLRYLQQRDIGEGSSR